jgi:hypothetical protein
MLLLVITGYWLLVAGYARTVIPAKAGIPGLRAFFRRFRFSPE